MFRPTGLQTALGGWHAVDRARVQLNGHPNRPPERFKDGFTLMVTVDAAQVIHMQRDAGMIDKSAKELDQQVNIKAADGGARKSDMPVESWPAGKVDHNP